MTPSDDLMDAALAVVGEAGVPGLTWKRIDERAGAAEGATFSLYPTMDLLVEAMLSDVRGFATGRSIDWVA